MPHQNLQYLPEPIAEKIRIEVEKLCAGKFQGDSRSFYEFIITLLPIQKMDRTTLIHRVEGLLYVTDLLWLDLRKVKNLDREEVVKVANIKSLGYYHHMLGSREHGDMVSTRQDFLNDPPTALKKLEDDVVGLVSILIKENSKKVAK